MPVSESTGRIRLLSKAEVLDRIGVSFPALWMWVRQKTIPPPREVGSRPFWLEAEIDEWILTRKIRPYKPVED
jgi:predicted DNA-binding transcriptional regulator AlpA